MPFQSTHLANPNVQCFPNSLHPSRFPTCPSPYISDPQPIKNKLQRICRMQQDRPSKKCRKIGPYILLRPIGKGSYSIVFQSRIGQDGPLYAVKQISLEKLEAKQLERIHQQVNVLSIIKHKNIVELIDFKQTARNLYLVFEHCKFTDLSVYAKKHFNGILPQEKVRKILTQLKGAFRQIRKHRIVHRDLKLQNILVTEDFEIKLADFGFAKEHDEDKFLKSVVGTPLTMAPEISQRKDYNQKCDIWSFGIITYELLFGCNPFFKSESQMLSRKEYEEATKKPFEFPREISPEAADFIKRTLVRDQQLRMSFGEFFDHPWLTQTQDNTNLSSLLRGQALKCQLTRSLRTSNKSTLQKQFIMNNCQSILSFCFFQFVLSYIQNNIGLWVNFARGVIDLQYSNKALTLLALALLLENIDQILTSSFVVLINANKQIEVPRYVELRALQTWEMSQFTKSFPVLIAKGRATIQEFLRAESSTLAEMKDKQDLRLSQLMLGQLRRQIQKGREQCDLKYFLRIKPWQGRKICINISSQILTQPALEILIRNLTLNLHYDLLCSKCVNMFKFMIVNELTPLELELQALRERVSRAEALVF